MKTLSDRLNADVELFKKGDLVRFKDVSSYLSSMLGIVLKDSQTPKNELYTTDVCFFCALSPGVYLNSSLEKVERNEHI